jgi:thiamine kinase-like enzyme
MDVTPRNFMIDLQERLCLLDWATAGFFPRYFELWSIEFTQHVLRKSFGDDIWEHLEVTPAEALEIPKLTLVYRYKTRFARSDQNCVVITGR